MIADHTTLRALRLEHGWTLAALSRETGVSVGVLSDLERGKCINEAVLMRLAEVYGLARHALPSPTLPPGLQELQSRPGQSLSAELISRLCRLEFRSGHDLSADEWQCLVVSLEGVD
ncbi:helix-turn-helix transcriptional regulator (plasmid) [Deinococcus sp. KNUC1210]|uniref:helix-turn-helix domain-containing protein n=1 Tax=Deinococcus sp. KNUC1210 TaxID=2917691 RepID=UPI001EEFD601|nr:helix-turn-helix transcriptional regulator [Deinococcus sp. KNUC1210]ULH13853.1 helix-turn-helix transcriptional regulator [Deinococcus sp. KNUC1210]